MPETTSVSREPLFVKKLEKVSYLPLTRPGNLHLLSILGNRTPRNKDIVPAQHLTELVVRIRFAFVLFLDHLLERLVRAVAGRQAGITLPFSTSCGAGVPRGAPVVVSDVLDYDWGVVNSHRISPVVLA